MVEHMEYAQMAGVRYDWVLLMAGINDILGYIDRTHSVDSLPPEQIIRALEELYFLSWRQGARVIAM